MRVRPLLRGRGAHHMVSGADQIPSFVFTPNAIVARAMRSGNPPRIAESMEHPTHRRPRRTTQGGPAHDAPDAPGARWAGRRYECASAAQEAPEELIRYGLELPSAVRPEHYGRVFVGRELPAILGRTS